MVYRVWRIVNPPNDPEFYPVASPAEGKALIDRLADDDLKDPGIGSNALGLEVLAESVMRGGLLHETWDEWYDDDGLDVDESPLADSRTPALGPEVGKAK